MKVAIIITDGVRQLMFTPETKQEKMALDMISPSDDIKLAVKHGSFHSGNKTEKAGYNVDMCQGGYLRAWTSNDSVMFVLTPTDEDESYENTKEAIKEQD